MPNLGWHFAVDQDDAGLWRWVMVQPCNRAIAQATQSYEHRQACIDAVAAVTGQAGHSRFFDRSDQLWHPIPPPPAPVFCRAIHGTDDIQTLLMQGVTEDGRRFEPHEVAGQLALALVLEGGEDVTEGKLRFAVRSVTQGVDLDRERALQHAVALSALPYVWPLTSPA